MAAKTGVKAAVKSAAAKPAAAPNTSEAAEKSAAAPGAGAPAGNAGPGSGATDGAASGDGSASSGESETDKAAREASEQLFRDEAEQLNREWDENAARVLAHLMGLLEEEAMGMDAERAERLKTTQTTAEEGAGGAVTLIGWALPEISEFPATVTLENHTRNRVAVAGANIALEAYGQAEVTLSQDQFAKLAKALTSSARAHKWDNLKGLQVKYDHKD